MLRMIVITALLLTVGTCGGWVASQFPVPLPWMLGSLLAAGLCAGWLHDGPLADYSFPMRFRTFFVALIGVMIGTQVDRDLVTQLVHLPWTIPALALFVVAAQGINLVILERWGGLDRATAFYGGAPGGLIESLIMGEAAGGDAKMLTMLQFMRIILVITLVPVGLSIWLGAPVGSAAGLTAGAEAGATTPPQILAIFVTAGVGLMVARWLHMPAAQLVGPLLLAGGLTLSGTWDVQLPGWLIATAQVVVGTGLGLRFKGLTWSQISRALRLSAGTVTAMLILGATLSLFLTQVTGVPILHLLISFAPGGVTEMSIIALSLAANPALVTTHHIIRILMTVVVMGWGARWLGIQPQKTP